MKIWLNISLLYFILGLLVYYNSFNNKFLLDDYAFLGNPVFSDTRSIPSQWNPYREPQLGDYRPLTYTVLDSTYAIFKNNYWQYHLLNLFLFVFASSLIYLFIEKVTGNFNLAMLSGLFYLIHPINGVIVNYMSASVFAFQVICMLGTILLLWGSLERKNDRTLYFLSLLFSFFSLLWHENGMMTPFYVSSVFLLFGKSPTREKLVYLFPYFLIAFLFGVFRALFASHGLDLKQMALSHMTGWEYPAVLFKVFAWYVSKLIYPQGIVLQWGTPFSQDHLISNILGLFLLFLISWLLLVRFAKERVHQLAIIWILTGFAPVLLASVVRSYTCAVIEPHWFVFSSIGFFISLASFCVFILNRSKMIGAVFSLVLILTFGSISYAYNQLWVDQKTYCLYWSKQAPYFNSTYYYLAYAYKSEGDLTDAKRYYKMALSGFPTDELIYYSLGVIDQAQGHFKEAEINYKMALRINPNSADAYDKLGIVYFDEGRFDKAKESFHRSLILNPFLKHPVLSNN